MTCYWPAADRKWLLHRPGRRSTKESTSFRQKRVALVVLTATTDLAAETRRRRRSWGASTLLRLHPHPLRFHLSTSSLFFLSAYLIAGFEVARLVYSRSRPFLHHVSELTVAFLSVLVSVSFAGSFGSLVHVVALQILGEDSRRGYRWADVTRRRYHPVPLHGALHRQRDGNCKKEKERKREREEC